MTIGSEAYKSLQQVESASENHTPLALLNLSSVWEKSILKNEKLLLTTKKKNDTVTLFHGKKAPNLSITHYMKRIFKYCRCSSSCFIMAQIYMDRFFHKNGGYLTSFNAHRLLITGVMIAAKFLDDQYYSNGYYAKVGGVSTEEMNKMELDFLFNIEFRLFVTKEVFLDYCQKLDREVM